MGYFPSDIPFMSHDELVKNGINIPKDNLDNHAIKRCPFCGSKSAAIEKKNGGYQVRCHYCGARGKYVVARSLKSRMEAISAWNRRDGKNNAES